MVEFCSRIVTRVGILLVHMHTYIYWGVAVEGGTAATVSTAEPRAWCHWKHLHGRFLQSRNFLQAESVCSGVSGNTNVCTFCWPLILHSRFLCWGFPGSKRLLGLGHPSILQIRTQCSAIDYDNRLWNKADSEGLERKCLVFIVASIWGWNPWLKGFYVSGTHQVFWKIMTRRASYTLLLSYEFSEMLVQVLLQLNTQRSIE